MVFLYHRRIVCNSIARSARAERRLPCSSATPSVTSSPPPSSFDGGEGAHNGATGSRTPMRKPPSGRRWTNVILALNILMYIGQVASQGKINSLIEMGQWWRLATASVLHANVTHLMVNCYSLNSIGPSVETMSGARRFLTIYFTSTIASSVMSCCMSKALAVGSSGAIFGLVNCWRFQHDREHIANVIVLNLVIGLLSPDIDNWGHLGGLLGGAITSWFIGPAWKYESKSIDGRSVFVDRAPIFRFARDKNPKNPPSAMRAMHFIIHFSG